MIKESIFRLKKFIFKDKFLFLLLISSVTILFTFSTLRHFLFHSSAWDLAIFDQAIYLISEGKTPISSILGFHILGDHAAFIFYFIAPLYKIAPDVHWLFLCQALALSIGLLPIYYLSKEIGLPENLARALTINYLLYPLIFNVNLFDFHPDVIAVPVILLGILAIYKRNFLVFVVSLVVILFCKAVFSLTVSAIGIWLILFKKKRSYGIVALILGITWFILSTQLIIPSFRGEEHSAISRYAYLGDSTFEIARNIFLKPILVFQHIFTIANLEYLLLLLSPLIWGLSFRHLSPLIAASPTLFLNLITNYSLQKDLLHQYSLPILPFLFLAVIEALVAKRGFLKQPQWIIVWGMIAFVSLAKVGFLWTQYLASIDNWKMKREVLTLVETKGSVLTISELAPHLSQRSVIQLIGNETENITLSDFEYILFDLRYPGWGTSKTALEKLKAQVSEKSQFQLCYERAGVNLWESITNKK